MTRQIFLPPALFGSFFLLFGCGSEPPSPTDSVVPNMANVDQNIALKTEVQVSRSRVAPGETVTLTATVTPVRAEAVRFSWVNVTGHGTLLGLESGTANGSFSIQWEAPKSLEPGAVKVEVIQLVVTAISQVISVTEKGVQSSYDIASETKTIPITITSTP
jgi:hypothetical protein